MSFFHKIIVYIVELMPRFLVKFFSRKYIAGETIESAINLVKNFNSKGIYATLDVLGESVNNEEEAKIAFNNAMNVFDAIVNNKLKGIVKMEGFDKKRVLKRLNFNHFSDDLQAGIEIKHLALFDGVMHRIPVVKKIYGSTQQLLATLRQEPGTAQRVVLIEFPSPGMQAVGFVTRTLPDPRTGKELAAVYVPTTPNPTSGYLELVPVDNIVSTDWSMDEAMTFIISGGAVAPKATDTRTPQKGRDGK